MERKYLVDEKESEIRWTDSPRSAARVQTRPSTIPSLIDGRSYTLQFRPRYDLNQVKIGFGARSEVSSAYMSMIDPDSYVWDRFTLPCKILRSYGVKYWSEKLYIKVAIGRDAAAHLTLLAKKSAKKLGRSLRKEIEVEACSNVFIQSKSMLKAATGPQRVFHSDLPGMLAVATKDLQGVGTISCLLVAPTSSTETKWKLVLKLKNFLQT